MGKTGAAALKVFAAGATAAATGVAAIGKEAVQSYADFEQLVGGVETLFGANGAKSIQEYADFVGKSVDDIKDEYEMLTEAQELCMSNARKAYKDAGLSMNEYMETVTGFAASLKQSVKDEVEAAEYADQAVIDMADNANKMGTNMESIQNAYQGFAKQNYTMLDNLKLGYGGTKEEMARLLEDAEKIHKKTTGEVTHYSINNLSDVFSAIHDVQVELGITGTTSKEAATTISGSTDMAKAAWSNLLVGIADDSSDFNSLVDDFVESVVTAADNLVPRIETVIVGIGALIEELAPVISQKVPEIIIEILPDLLKAGMDFILAIVQGIIDNLPELVSAAGEIVDAFLEGIGDLCPAMEPVTDALSYLKDHFDDLKGYIEELIPIIEGAILAFAGLKAGMAIQSAVQNFQEAKLALHMFGTQASGASLAQASLNGVLTLGETVVALLTGKLTLAELASAGLAKAQVALNAVISANPIALIVLAIVALVAIFIVLWQKCDWFREFWIDLWEKVKTFATEAFEALIEFFTVTVPEFIDKVIEFFYELPEKLAEWGASVKETVCNAVSEMISAVMIFFEELPGKIAYWLGFAVGAVIKFGIDLIDWVSTNVPIIIDNIVTFFAELPSRIAEFVLKVLDIIVNWGSEMKSKAVEIGKNFINNIVNFIKGLPEKINDWLTKTIEKISSFVTDMKDKAVEAGKGFLEKITEEVKKIPEKMKEIGKDIVDGLINGIKGAWNSLTEFMSGLVTDFFEGVKDGLDIHSPSRKFKWIGQMCVAGFDEGLEDLADTQTLTKNIDARLNTVRMNRSGVAAFGGTGYGFGGFNQTVNIYQPVSTPDEMARAMRLESRYGLMRGAA